MIWRCFIPSEPCGRAEKRVTFKTNDGRIINRLADKPKQAGYKAYLKGFVGTHRPVRLLDGPLVLTIWIYRSRPRTLPKRAIYPTTRPDWTNYVKLAEDCLLGIVIRDDSTVVDAEVHKRFAESGDQPGLRIEVEEKAAGR